MSKKRAQIFDSGNINQLFDKNKVYEQPRGERILICAFMAQ